MSTAALKPGALEMGLQIRGGPRHMVPLAGRDLDAGLIFADESQASRAPSYESLAEKIAENDRWKASRKIFVTSPGAREGKSCTAFNLGWTLASRFGSVLVVELNLERPDMRRLLGGARLRYGIDSALRGIASREESAFTLGSESLQVAAVRDPMSGRLVRRFLPEADLFLGWATEHYQWVVIDCPSVLSSRWTQWFRRNAADVLLLARAGRTPGLRLRRAARRLGDSLQGVVLNREGREFWQI